MEKGQGYCPESAELHIIQSNTQTWSPRNKTSPIFSIHNILIALRIYTFLLPYESRIRYSINLWIKRLPLPYASRVRYLIELNSHRRVHQGAKRPLFRINMQKRTLIFWSHIHFHCLALRVSRSVSSRTRTDEVTKERSDPRTHRVQSFHVLYSSVSFWGLCPESLFIVKSCWKVIDNGIVRNTQYLYW